MTTSRMLIGSHCQPVLDSNGSPLLKIPANWQGIKLHKSIVPANAEFGPQFTGVPMLSFGLAGTGQCWIRSSGKTIALTNGPPYFNIHGAAYERDSGYRKGEMGLAIAITLPLAALQHYVPEDSEQFDLQCNYGLQDKTLRHMVLELAWELENGLPNGIMYAEGINLAILGWLKQHYTVKVTRKQLRLRFSPQRTALLTELIDSSLATNLTIEKMAKKLQMSPSHFCALFRNTFNLTPHQYVMNKRIEKAAMILRSEPHTSVTDIAITTGFANQAHFTYAFKRYMKQTPSKWRANK